MNAQQKLQTFEAAARWQFREKRRLLKIIRAPRARKHQAWKQLLELAARNTQLKRELARFLKQQTAGNK